MDMAFSRAATFCSAVAEGAAEVDVGSVVRVVALDDAVVEVVTVVGNVRDVATEVAEVEEEAAQEEEKVDTGAEPTDVEDVSELRELTGLHEGSRAKRQSPTLNQNDFIGTPPFE